MKNSFYWISLLEGISLIVLFGIAMPMKYIMGNDMLIPYAGMTHGVLWMIYLVASLSFCSKNELSVLKWLVMLIASVIPLGFIAVDKLYIKPTAETV